MLFMRDWEVGDRIAVILPSSSGAAPFTPVVTAAAIVAGAGRAALGMSIGDTSQMSDKAATVSKVSSTTQRVEDLEQSERALPAVLTTDPGADRFVFWDDSAGALAFLSFSSALVITGTALDVAQATDILAGKVELATPAETVTGVSGSLATTPAGVAAALAALLPSGMIQPTALAAAPAGWLLCDGSAVSRTTYAALFAAIGTTYGVGNGSTTFNVPNLKGRVPVGIDTGQTEFDVRGETGGAKTHTLTSAEMPAHIHTFPEDGHTFAWGTSKTVHINGTSAVGGGTSSNGLDTRQNVMDRSESTGGGGAHNNLQPYMALHYLIKT